MNLFWQLKQATMASNEVHVNVWIGVVVTMLCHQILLIDKLDTQHVPTMPMVQPDVEPAVESDKASTAL